MNDKEEIYNLRNEAREIYKLNKTKIVFHIYDFTKEEIKISRKNNILSVDCDHKPELGLMCSAHYQYCIRPEQLIIDSFINENHELVIMLLDSSNSNDFELIINNAEI